MTASHLILQHRYQGSRAATEFHDTGWSYVKLVLDRNRGSALGLVHAQLHIAAVKGANRSELAARNEHLARSDAAKPKLAHDPAKRVGLVGEADFDVLGGAGDPR